MLRFYFEGTKHCLVAKKLVVSHNVFIWVVVVTFLP